MKMKKVRIVFMGLVMFMVAAMSAIADESAMERVNDPDTNSAAPATILQPSLVDKLNRGEETFDVFVLLKGHKECVGKIKEADSPAKMKIYHSEIHGKQDRVLNRLDRPNFTLKHRFNNILGFAGKVNRHALEALLAMPEVEVIEEDPQVEAHTKQGIPLMSGSQVRSSYDGTGVSIAIVDTGINYLHYDLGYAAFPNTKVIGGYDYGDDDDDPMDYDGHGTAVAGIAAGSTIITQGNYIGGVAPNAKLYALKVVQDGSGKPQNLSAIGAAWDWVIDDDNRPDDPENPILIINTSFGFGNYTSACDNLYQSMADFADAAVAKGITLFASSGNNAYTNSITTPACLSNVISVGAVYDANIGGPHEWVSCTDQATAADQVACYSNSANILSILAPSNNAYTTDIGYFPDEFQTFSGTSAASPYTAGAAAVLQSYAKATTGAYFTPAVVKARLLVNGDPILDTRNGLTKPRVNIDRMVDETLNQQSIKIGGTSYTTLQAAYNAATNGATIKVKANCLTGPLNVNRNISVNVQGGYNYDYSYICGMTTMKGMTQTVAGGGTLTIKNFILTP